MFVAHLQGLVFAEQTLACIVGLLQVLHGLGLRHRYQPHPIGKRSIYLIKIFLNHNK